MREQLLQAANVLIAIDYLLLGIFFIRRIRLKLRKSNPKAVLAYLAIGTFFLGCVHSHLDMIFLAESEHWYSTFNIVSHWLQGIGGLVFWVLAQRYLVINIFDRKLYERATSNGHDTEQRLDYLAIKAGLVKR